ncbi:hypothetical protein [Methylobacterium dankookense]|uniref:Uncharacterized protein n=1 Tax=Methylobacterium dankookense TaxID=560405 RepID=A0A564G435_9HYPH|nr:hypothetical protein [Methylobacterium dankookense]GJD58919.1 hypothetical protein IFDJLNFL_4845 [Methylobacterium dankookense]VUF15259.1 hypothetical protein MTDSW087_04995 [Methylobacterium dankookense]
MSLNERNNLTLWLAVAANALLLYGCVRWEAVRLSDAEGVLREWRALFSIGFGGLMATVLNQLLGVDLKGKLVYWRRRHALPGHRAFSEHAQADARVDLAKLRRKYRGDFPEDPVAQNAEWYCLYKGMRDDVVVKDANRVFLLLRDYASLSALFIPLLGTLGFLLVPSAGVAAGFLAWLVVQYLLAKTAAANAGVRLVRDVLALKAATGR